jgi:hypothetical protein
MENQACLCLGNNSKEGKRRRKNKMSKSRSIMMLVAMVLVGLCLTPVVWGASKDTITITAKTSDGGFTPATNSSGNAWVYAYERACNLPFIDTLNVDFKIENTGTAYGPYDIGLRENPNASLLESYLLTALPSTYTLIPSPPTSAITFSVSEGTTVSAKIKVQSTTSLAPGDYLLTLAISYDSSSLKGPTTGADIKFIHVTIHVNKCEASVPSCFFTSSEGLFLENCDGEPVSKSTGGTFELNNKKNGPVVATNPGQFYYNYIWTNDGPAVDVEIQTVAPENLVPHGANALHAYTFDTSGFTQNLDSFNMVNHDGTPCGPSGPCTIHIGVGETLWVTWHLEYANVGSVKGSLINWVAIRRNPTFPLLRS